ncbi:NUDIX hydrolase [Streptomyces kanamyceticus]|uniref:NUDIX hydrolase n=2 Tax=Streptomyces kanamyceticus TaxID=1967 RepID=A0A5J6GLZ6_STRKN|nr:NUDIX hydrolase [Streptomyces kanamyceticus]
MDRHSGRVGTVQFVAGGHAYLSRPTGLEWKVRLHDLRPATTPEAMELARLYHDLGRYPIAHEPPSSAVPTWTVPQSRAGSPCVFPAEPAFHQGARFARAEGMAMSNGKEPVPVPQRWMGASVVIRNEAGAVLLLKPHETSGWRLPGGLLRADEMPHAGLMREVRAATGLLCETVHLLAVDYVRAGGGAPEGVEFVYDGGVVEAGVPMLIEEAAFSGRAWVQLSRLKGMMRPLYERRLRCAVDALGKGTVYLVQGLDVATSSR